MTGSFMIGAPIVDIPIRTLWDAGAYISVISEAIAKQLGLVSTEQRSISGTILTNHYAISVTLPSNMIFPIIRVAEWGGY